MMIGSTGAAHAAPVVPLRMPLASGFDLTRFVVQPAAAHGVHTMASRWLIDDITPPPGAPRDPPLVKIRGRKVKFLMRF